MFSGLQDFFNPQNGAHYNHIIISLVFIDAISLLRSNY